MDMDKLASIFEAVKVLPLRPDDVLLFKAPIFLRDEQRVWIKDALAREFGDRRVVVIDGGCDLEIIRPEDAPFA